MCCLREEDRSRSYHRLKATQREDFKKKIKPGGRVPGNGECPFRVLYPMSLEEINFLHNILTFVNQKHR